MRLSTKNLPPDQQNIVLEIKDEAVGFVGWFIDYLESQIAVGTRFLAEQTIELGWSILKLRQAGDVLEIDEPDFDSMPIRWLSGVNNTIRHLYLQRLIGVSLIGVSDWGQSLIGVSL